jgi:hypothetical protein
MAGWRSVIAVLAAWLAASAVLAVLVPRVAMPVSVVALAAAAIVGAMREKPALATSDNRIRAVAEDDTRGAAPTDPAAGGEAGPGPDQQPHLVRAEDQVGPPRH